MKNIIEQLRKENNLSLEDLSEITDISPDDLRLIEKNQLEPSLMDAHMIKKALKKDFIADVFIFDDLD